MTATTGLRDDPQRDGATRTMGAWGKFCKGTPGDGGDPIGW